MTGFVYYNEIDPFAIEWLGNIIREGLIAPGAIDKRSITDVQPEDLQEFTQCHFFAGIGVWSHALRQAGWSDDRPVWTGSCPCQPFSSAGKGKGVDDERHLWPQFFRLIRECHPSVVFGEQVARKAGLAWFDSVSTDLEGAGYAVGAADLSACGVGAPHLRQRLYFVADDPNHGRRQERANDGRSLEGDSSQRISAGSHSICVAGGMADANEPDPGQHSLLWTEKEDPAQVGGHDEGSRVGNACSTTRQQNSSGPYRHEEANGGEGRHKVQSDRTHRRSSSGKSSGVGDAEERRATTREQQGQVPSTEQTGETIESVRTFWDSCDWVLCRDPKGPRWRPVEPGTFPLANGAPARVGRLRGYGNAIVAPLAQEFVGAYMDLL